jgi:hypothetical protein
MKKLITTLFLVFFSFSAASLADDVTDFQLEGISLYDSALDHFPERQIKNNLQDWYNSKEYSTASLRQLPKFKVFEDIQISFKTDDKKYIILSIDGVVYKDINDCLKELDKTEKEFSTIFKNTYKGEKYNYAHAWDKTGNSKITDVFWKFNSGDRISAMCVDWSKEIEDKFGYKDEWRIRLGGEEFGNFLYNKAYK